VIQENHPVTLQFCTVYLSE